jgi:hypothetical protein
MANIKLKIELNESDLKQMISERYGVRNVHLKIRYSEGNPREASSLYIEALGEISTTQPTVYA